MDNDIIDISSLDAVDSSPLKTSSNFGGGIELLMNEKKGGGGGGSAGNSESIELNDLEKLETELNDMAGVSNENRSLFTDTLPGMNIETEQTRPSVSFQDGADIGRDTAGAAPQSSTWDGFSKFNEIPVDPEKNISSQPTQTKEEILREKFQLLRKLESLEHKGVHLSKKYTMESPLLEMKGEYETILDEKAKQNSIKFQGNMLMTCINGVEFLNSRFDPFDIKLDGWSEQVGENIDDYDDVFAELYDKYKSKATMSPELRLLFQLGGSAMMLHMTNTMFKTSMPGMDDVLRQNPELAQQFQRAAMDSMGKQSPGFTGFMNNMSNPEPAPRSGSAPPPPMATQGPSSVPVPTSRPGNNNSYASRPDLARSMGASDGINISETYGSASAPEKSSRAEMRGPSDIDNILAGLKTKTRKVNVGAEAEHQSQSQSQSQSPISMSETERMNDSSTISISDLKDMQMLGNVPKKSTRRRISDKNTISLDI